MKILFKLVLILVATLISTPTYAEPSRGKPTPEQITWHKMEQTMFLHFSPATFQNREYDNLTTPLSKLTLEKLDTDQWCRAALAFGAKQIVYVAKHVGGFCWWQTKTTNYGIRNTPYKNGKGDVLAELSTSCRKYGLKLGVYIYPGDTAYGAGIGSGGRTKDPSKQAEYNKVFREQLIEVLSRYGKISEVWFDGSLVIEVNDILDKYVPKAMVFQGPRATVRWPGNENGISPYPAWQTVTKAKAKSGVATGNDCNADGDFWLPMEFDTTLLNKAWFWKKNWEHRIKTVDQLMHIYYNSVGRGGVLLLNASPDPTGLIPESHMARYKAFGKAIKNVYANKKGQTRGKGKQLTIKFDKPTEVNHIITMEDIREGHIIRAYVIEGLVNGKWTKLHSGTSVGYKEIDVIKTVKLDAIRLRVTKAVDTPLINSFAVYNVKSVNKISVAAKVKKWVKVSDLKLTGQWQTLDIDLTKQIDNVGQYEVELRSSKDLKVRKAVVVMAVTEAPRLITKLDRANAWNINRTAMVVPGKQGKTILRIEVKGSKGSVYIR